MGTATPSFGSKALLIAWGMAVICAPLAARPQVISSEPLAPPAGANAATNYTPHLSAPQPQGSPQVSVPEAAIPKATKAPTTLTAAPAKPSVPLASNPPVASNSLLGHSAPGVADGSQVKHPPSGITTPHKVEPKKVATAKPKRKKPVAGATVAKTKSSPTSKPKATTPADANS